MLLLTQLRHGRDERAAVMEQAAVVEAAAAHARAAVTEQAKQDAGAGAGAEEAEAGAAAGAAAAAAARPARGSRLWRSQEPPVRSTVASSARPPSRPAYLGSG